MDVEATVKAMENQKALEALAGCVGEQLTGYGTERDALVLRFANGVRVKLHVAMCEQLLDDVADVLSAFGRFLGGHLRAVDGNIVCLAGIGEVRVSAYS
jgi:hypothetical protein